MSEPFNPEAKARPESEMEAKLSEMKNRIENEMDHGHGIQYYLRDQIIEIAERGQVFDASKSEEASKIIMSFIEDNGEGIGYGNDSGVALLGKTVAEYEYIHREVQSDERTQNTFYADEFREILPACLEEIQKKLKT